MTSSESRRLPATYVALNFKGESLDLDLVSSIMGIGPTLSYRKGDQYEIKGKSKQRQFGLWVYSTRNSLQSDSLKRHLEVVEVLIIGSKASWPYRRIGKIKSLVRGRKAEFRVDVFWFGSQGSELPKISLSFETIVTMAGGTIQTDFHRDGDAVRAA